MSRVRNRLSPLIACALLMAGPTHAQKLSKQAQRFLALTPSDFQRAMTMKDDSLDTVARISTEKGYQEKQGLLGIVWNDNFLRAFIDKKTGETTYQLYQIISYDGDWRFYQTVNYEAPDGPESKEVTVIDRSVDACGTYRCSFTEHLGFDVPEQLMRQLAGSYTPEVPRAWHFKFGSKAGVEFQDGVNVAEVVAILSAVDQYRASHQFANPAKPPAPAEARPAASASPPKPATTATAPTKRQTAKKPSAKRAAVTCVTCP